MSLRRNALLLVLATVLLGVLGAWSGSAALARLWCLPAGVLLLGLAYEAWWAARMRLRLQVHSPERWLLGRAATLRLQLAQLPDTRYRPRRTLSVELMVAAPPELAVERGVQTLRVPAEGVAECALPASARRLGRFAWPALPVRLAGVLGLAWWSRALRVAQSLQVLPDLVSEAERGAGLVGGGAQAARRSGVGGEVLQLRDYRSGDAPRLIDWKASARRGRLISRDLAEDQHLQIVVAVDIGSASGWRAGELERLSLYANIATRLAQRAVWFDDRVGLLLYADRPLLALAPAQGMAAVTRLRAHLAAARVQEGQGNPLLAAHRLRSLLPHRGLVVLLTHLDEPSAFTELAAATRLLLPKHLPLIAGVASEQAERLAARPVRDEPEAWRALAAQEYAATMGRNVQALRSLGAQALRGSPGELDALVLRTYLNLRERRQIA